jgi:peptide/nickel transport system substrate-binding protein
MSEASVSVAPILAAETPVAWVYHSRGVQGVTARLLGVRMDLRGEMPTVARWRLSGAAAIQ